MGIILSRPAVHIPETIITNEFLETIVDTSDEWIRERTGMGERRISLDLGISEMGAISAKKLLDKELIFDREIDEIIFATNLHDGSKEFPCHAGHVAKELEIENAALSDVGAGCSGLVYAIRQAHNNLVADPSLKKILVIGGERLTDMTDYSDRNTCVLFGDGAGAYLLERLEGQEGIINNVVGGKPDEGSEDFPFGKLSLEKKLGKKLVSDGQGGLKTIEAEQNYLVMDGRSVFEYAAPIMEHAVRKVLEGTQYILEDLNGIIPHGANMRIIDRPEKRLRRDEFDGVIYTNLQKYGNTSTASIPIAANEAYEKEIIKRGDLVAYVAFGAGFTWGANLFRSI